jgi:hypothetical protein
MDLCAKNVRRNRIADPTADGNERRPTNTSVTAGITEITNATTPLSSASTLAIATIATQTIPAMVRVEVADIVNSCNPLMRDAANAKKIIV